MNHKFIPFKKEDISQERFYRVPKAFVEDEYFKTEMDSNMKLMYSLLRDRYELSIKNNWIDQNGIVYCLYSRDNLADDINVSDNTIRKCINKLTELNLMKEVRKGQGKPNFMYISKVESMYSLRPSINEVQEHQKLNPSDTELSETEKTKRYTISRNGGYILNYYDFKFFKTFNKDHPTVTDEQLNRIITTIDEIKSELDLSDELLMDCIDIHFDELPKNNDGKIFGFIGSDYTNTPIRRYIDY